MDAAWDEHKNGALELVRPHHHALVKTLNPSWCEVSLHVVVPSLYQISYWNELVDIARWIVVWKMKRQTNVVKSIARHHVVESKWCT
jgi:hypothetical protein